MIVGGLLAFLFGWYKDRLREKHDIGLLREAIYQELANNYEAILYWTDPSRADFDSLRQDLPRQITFFAYEAAGKNPGGFYRIPEHGAMIASYRELRQLCEYGPRASDKMQMELLKTALATIEACDPKRPETKTMLRSKLQPQHAKNIK